MTEEERKLLGELDDIGFIGIPNYKVTEEEWALMAQKGEEARAEYRAEMAQKNLENL